MNYFSQYKWMWWTIILLVVLNIASIAFFLFGRHEDKKREYGMKHFMENELKLNEEQKKMFESEKNIHFQSVIPIFDSMKIERIAVSKILFSATPDSLAVLQHINKLSRLQAQLEWLTFKHFSRLKNILTPEQQAKFEKDLNDMFQNAGHRHGGGKGKLHTSHSSDGSQPNEPPPSF